MYLILDNGTNVCGTADELVDFLIKYKSKNQPTNEIIENPSYLDRTGTTGAKPSENEVINVSYQEYDPYLEALTTMNETRLYDSGERNQYYEDVKETIRTGICPTH